MVKKYEEFKANYETTLRKMKKKYKWLKIKYFLLFVLPIFLITLIFQVVKQILKIKAKELGTKVSASISSKVSAVPAAVTPVCETKASAPDFSCIYVSFRR